MNPYRIPSTSADCVETRLARTRRIARRAIEILAFGVLLALVIFIRCLSCPFTGEHPLDF